MNDFEKSRIEELVTRQTDEWKNTKDQGSTKADLAQLRRDVGKSFEEAQNSWPIIMNQLSSWFFPQYDRNQSILPATSQMKAVYYALSLFAVHNQGWKANVRLKPEKDPSFGEALYLWVQGSEENEARLMKRLGILLSQKDMEGVYAKIRPIISLLKSKKIALDYSKMASDFYLCRSQRGIKSVTFRWMSDYYFTKNTQNKQKEKKNEE